MPAPSSLPNSAGAETFPPSARVLLTRFCFAGYALAKASKGDLKKHDNRNPKGSAQLENIKKRLSPKEFAAFERGESCHRAYQPNHQAAATADEQS